MSTRNGVQRNHAVWRSDQRAARISAVKISTLALAATTLCWCAAAQPASILLFPAVLYAGAGPSQLHISILQGPSSGLGVRWNGVAKPPSAKPNPGFGGGYDID